MVVSLVTIIVLVCGFTESVTQLMTNGWVCIIDRFLLNVLYLQYIRHRVKTKNEESRG